MAHRRLSLFKSALCAAVGAAALSLAAQAEDPPPIDAFAMEPALSQVQVSPGGSRLSGLLSPGLGEAPVAAVWRVDDLAAEPHIVAGNDRMRIAGVSWVNDDTLFVSLTQPVNRGFRQNQIEGTLALYRIDAREWTVIASSDADDLDVQSSGLISTLPLEPNVILLALGNRHVRYDIETGRRETTFRQSDRWAGVTVDRDGEARIAVEFRDGRLNYFVRAKGEDDWRPVLANAQQTWERAQIQPVGFGEDLNTAFVWTSADGEFARIRTFDVEAMAFGEEVFSVDGFDAPLNGDSSYPGSLVLSQRAQDFGALLGVVYATDEIERVWTDPQMAALQASLDAALPGRDNAVVSYDRAFETFVVSSSRPDDPGQFFVLRDGALTALGRPYPVLSQATLGAVESVRYPARDGLTIQAYVTYPPVGEAPYPAIVVPHGGPWVRDVMGYDDWAQFLASRGYLVLQPNYRGSTGFGRSFWLAGDGEWGRAKQDDLDDGMAWLVDQGLADPGRLAMFGFSYGGYTAMVAGVQAGAPYQCAIAGAGIGNLTRLRREIFLNPFTRQFQRPSLNGVNPLDFVRQSDLPMLVFHGDADQTVSIGQSEEFVRALRRAGRDVPYEVFEDMAHGIGRYDHRARFFAMLERYLAEDCGPGGL